MTRSAFRLNLLAGLVVAAAGGAHATAATCTNVPAGANTGLPFASLGNAANPSGDSPAVGEVFSFTGNETLESFSFYAIGNVTSALQLNVAQWNPDTNAKNQASNAIGSLLLAGAPVTETCNAAGGTTTLQFDSRALSLAAGTRYVAFLTSSDPSVTGLQLSRTQTAADASGLGIGNA